MELTKENFIQKIKSAGVVGAGGAGFPTHIKLNTNAEYFIVNIAECEPLLRVDQQIAEKYAPQIVETIQIIHTMLGAKTSFIAIKKKYHNAVKALSSYISEIPFIKIKFLENVYPAGDEQDIVYNCTGKIVPEGGIPLDVGVVVDNVGTVLNIYNALNDKPVTDRWVTISGAVKEPQTLNLPVGTFIKDALQLCGGPAVEDYVIIDGGPMMGNIVSLNDTIKKTTTGILVFPSEHYFIKRKQESIQVSITHSRSVCEQCYFCTEYCPRHLLGHTDLKPHLMMRRINYLNDYNLESYVEAYLCCECGVCSYYACPMLLSPKDIYHFLKEQLAKNNIKNPYNKKKVTKPHSMYKYRRAPIEKLLNKIDVKRFEHPAKLKEIEPNIKHVRIDLKQHIGVPAEPVVYLNKKVKKGDIIAKIPDNKLGANIHSSITGIITEITEKYIEITAR